MASHVQMEAMKHRIKQADIGSIDPEMKARIFTMLQACAFTEGDRLQLMELLSPKQAEGQQKEQKQQRLPMQTLFPMLLEYFTEEEWSQMRKPTMSAAMHMVMARAIALGARNPSERCCASITSLLLHVCGMAEINMTARQQLLNAFKADFKKKVRHLPPSRHDYLVDLPSPEILQTTQPALFKEVFGDAQPTASKINLAVVALPRVACRVSTSSLQKLELHALEERSRSTENSVSLEILKQVVSMQKDAVDIMRSGSFGSGRPLEALLDQHRPTGAASSSHALPLAPPPQPTPLALRLPSAHLQHLGVSPVAAEEASENPGQAAAAPAPLRALPMPAPHQALASRTTENPSAMQIAPLPARTLAMPPSHQGASGLRSTEKLGEESAATLLPRALPMPAPHQEALGSRTTENPVEVSMAPSTPRVASEVMGFRTTENPDEVSEPPLTPRRMATLLRENHGLSPPENMEETLAEVLQGAAAGSEVATTTLAMMESPTKINQRIKEEFGLSPPSPLPVRSQGPAALMDAMETQEDSGLMAAHRGHGSSSEPSLAAKILADAAMASALAKAKVKDAAKAKKQAQKAEAKAKPDPTKAVTKAVAKQAKAKPETTKQAKAKPETTKQAKSKPEPTKQAKAKPEPTQVARAPGTPKAGLKRARVEHESTRNTFRARLSDGTSKGFHYADESDKESKRLEAYAYIGEEAPAAAPAAAAAAAASE